MTRLLIAIVSAIIFCSCHTITGSGRMVTQTKHPDHFEGIKTSGPIDIEVMNDSRSEIKVEADDNVMPYVIIKVDNGLLDVSLKSNEMYHNIHVKAYVTAPVLSRLYVTGSGSIISVNTLKNADRIETKVSGSGDIDATVDAPGIFADVSGSGTLKLQGRTKNLECSVSGSGDLRCHDLLSENTDVSVSGSGTAHVFSSVNLIAKVSGSGDVRYSGNPSSPQIRRSGSGSVSGE